MRSLTSAVQQHLGSYCPSDVTFLLRDISGLVEELDSEQRERAIQRGVHYSEMLPKEYRPTDAYMRLFEAALATEAKNVARLTGIVAEKILRVRGPKAVLVSLARAGTPAGILMRRYLLEEHGINLPHYSISIIRGKGLDTNAVRWLVERFGDRRLLFVDGWTGKGAITKELEQACAAFNDQTGYRLQWQLAVLADPGNCAHLSGTHDDCLIPSACLNATVSGLLSRTFHRADIIGPLDFHGVRWFQQLATEDVSRRFVDTVAGHFASNRKVVAEALEAAGSRLVDTPSWSGWRCVAEIGRHFAVDDIHRIKPGVGETTRVLLRRVPWKILIHAGRAAALEHVLQLARERQVEVANWSAMDYACCGLIRKVA